MTPDGTVFNIQKKGKLYYLFNICTNTHECRKSLYKWHKKLGHCNARDILKLENCVSDMKITDKQRFDCETCALGKMNAFRNHNADSRAKKCLDTVFWDVAGPIDPISKVDFRYAVSFLDDFSGINSVYFVKKKSDVKELIY